MKEWLKEFLKGWHDEKLYCTSNGKPCPTYDQFIEDYLHNNTIPLPTAEKTGEAAIKETDGLSPFESFIAGVEWFRVQITE